jgi:hypothetical protein
VAKGFSCIRLPCMADGARLTLPDDLLQLLFELCIAFITEEFRDGQPSSSTLVYYSGVLGLQGTRETF